MASKKPSKITASSRTTTPLSDAPKLSDRTLRSIIEKMSRGNRTDSISYDERGDALREKLRAERRTTLKFPFSRQNIEFVSSDLEMGFERFRLGKIDPIITLILTDRGDGYFEIDADHVIKIGPSPPLPKFRHEIFSSSSEALDAALEYFSFWYRLAVRHKRSPTLVPHRWW
jgi:hypothetical protein